MQARDKTIMSVTTETSIAIPKDQIFSPKQTLPAHRHRDAYASLVIKGHYVESSLDGHVEVRSGYLVIHPPYHFHSNRIEQSEVRILNLPLSAVDVDSIGYCGGEVADPAALASVAARNPELALKIWLEEAGTLPRTAPPEWLSRFTAKLLESRLSIRTIAIASGVSHEHACRMCRRWYGMSPIAMRRERCLRYAMQLLRDGATPAIAAIDAGFSDQPHLTRALKSMTGITPGRLRKNLADQVHSRLSVPAKPT